jgi:hypothetical protein
MILAWLLLLTGLTISAVAIYYSVVGLTAIFSAAVIPIIVMGSALEIGKLVCASWLKANWERAPSYMKYYMISAVAILMLITSMGIFGFLSKAHNDQNLVSGDVTSKIAIYDEKIKTAKDNIDANRKALKQMDEAVDQVMGRSSDEKGAEKAVTIRRSQQKERARLQSEITSEQKIIATVNEERAPIAAEVRKVEAEVGPIKYIAKFIYGDHGADENMLEKAVTWIIILIVIVFDPLAVIMLLAAQMTFGWKKERDDEHLLHNTVPHTETPVVPQTEIAEGNSPLGPVVDIVSPEPTVTEQEAVWPFPTYQEITPAHTEETASETPLTALGGDITATEEPLGNIPSEVEQWNKMIEEAERAVADEKATVASLEELEKRIQADANAVETDRQLLRKMKQDFETGEIASLPWEVVETIEEEKADEESKKKKYMTKDQSGQIQVKDRK